MAGHLLGNAFPALIDNVEIIIVSLIVVTAIPVILSFRRNRVTSRRKGAAK
jgi:hypothetical protein